MKRIEYTVRLLRAAEDDLNEIVTYIAVDNRSAAELITVRIENNLAYLASHPYLGKIPNEEELARLGYRFLVVQDYLIFYTIEGNTVWVHRILQGARDYLHLIRSTAPNPDF